MKGLQRNLQRKWRAYVEGNGRPSMIADKRPEANAARRFELPEGDRKECIAAVVDCGGRVSQGVNEAKKSGRLSERTMERWIDNPVSKSYVPTSVRRQVTLDAKKAVEARYRPRKTEMNGAYIPGDPSGQRAGSVFTLDDATLPLYHWLRDPEAPNGFRVLRGQFIPVICERSWLVLAYTLHSDRNYTGRLIRGLLNSTHQDWGLPEVLRVEQGIWKTAKILKGDSLDLSETELGLREFGVRFSHAQWSHGKATAERVIGMIQNQLERLPGYSSRNEITQPNEILRKQLLEIERGKVHPSKYLLSRDEFAAALDGLIADYNKTKQQGLYLDNVSPLEFWNENQPEEGLVHLGPKASWLLANHVLPLTVGKKGLLLRKSLGGGLYANEHTGRLTEQKVLVRVNPDELDHITIFDPKWPKEPLFVPRIGPLPKHTATDEQYKAAKANVDAHNRVPRTIYRSIEPLLAVHKFRKLAVDRATAEMGEKMEVGAERFKVERNKKAATARKVSELSRELKIAPRIDAKNIDAVARGLELAREARELRQAAVGTGAGASVTVAQPAAKKTYTLASPLADRVTEKECRIYWALWSQVQKLRPNLDRHALTRKTIGSGKSHKEFSRAEWGRMVATFNAILGPRK